MIQNHLNGLLISGWTSDCLKEFLTLQKCGKFEVWGGQMPVFAIRKS